VAGRDHRDGQDKAPPEAAFELLGVVPGVLPTVGAVFVITVIVVVGMISMTAVFDTGIVTRVGLLDSTRGCQAFVLVWFGDHGASSRSWTLARRWCRRCTSHYPPYDNV
jgi:hypothetical protein